jgi:transcriptional regulator with XRE-family HTH domain
MNLKRDWIIEARKAKGLSRPKLGRALDISESYIEKIESGERDPSLDVAFGICKELDLDINNFRKTSIEKTPA